ncbi:MAG: thiolase family protein [Elusimicrobiota bacterium]
MTPDVFILSGARTPFALWSRAEKPDGTPGGALAKLDPFDLAAAAVTGALARAGLAAEDLDFLVFGNCYHIGAHACYGGRYVSHRIQAPVALASSSVNLACGAGLEALRAAAREINSAGRELVAACGSDSSSLVPRAVFAPSFTDLWCGRAIAQTSQDMARESGISRQDQDDWALLSHRRATAARKAGIFKEEIVRAGDAREDDAIREGAEPEFFAASKPLQEGGNATHANTHAITDGGSALILASERAAAGKTPLGRLVGVEIAGVSPERMAEGSAAAVRKLLAQIGWDLGSVDLFEINETFASQTLVDIQDLGLDPERVNVNGGALALGHPFAGSGARLVQAALGELGRRKLRRAVAAICVGGGLGIAAAVERV